MYPVSDSLSIAARERRRNARGIRSRPRNRVGCRLVPLANRRAHHCERRGCRATEGCALGNQVPLLCRQDVLRRNRLLRGCHVLRHLPLSGEKDSMRVLLVSTHVDQTTGYSKVAYNLLRQMATLSPQFKIFHFGFQRHPGHTNHRKVPEGVIA